jgi:hypothetical protein
MYPLFYEYRKIKNLLNSKFSNAFIKIFSVNNSELYNSLLKYIILEILFTVYPLKSHRLHHIL